MRGIITREDVIKDKMINIKEENYLVQLFKVAEEVNIGDEIELQNNFTFAAMRMVEIALEERSIITFETVNKGIQNVYYIVELYLKGFSDNKPYMGLEEFLLLVKANKADQIIEEAKRVFEVRINRLKKIISKSKKKIPWGDIHYMGTKALLEEIDSDLRYCTNFPTTPANLRNFYFGSFHDLFKPIMITKPTGVISLEKVVYGLYSELRILTKFDRKDIDLICKKYIESVQLEVPFNLFERVINNYLFATLYSDTPEKLRISKIDASLIIREIKMGTLNSEELIKNFIEKYEFKDYEIAYLKKYGNYLQGRINSLRKSNYFGELFVITKPK